MMQYCSVVKIVTYYILYYITFLIIHRELSHGYQSTAQVFPAIYSFLHIISKYYLIKLYIVIIIYYIIDGSKPWQKDRTRFVCSQL